MYATITFVLYFVATSPTCIRKAFSEKTEMHITHMKRFIDMSIRSTTPGQYSHRV